MSIEFSIQHGYCYAYQTGALLTFAQIELDGTAVKYLTNKKIRLETTEAILAKMKELKNKEIL